MQSYVYCVSITMYWLKKEFFKTLMFGYQPIERNNFDH